MPHMLSSAVCGHINIPYDLNLRLNAKNATQHPGIPDITPKKKHCTAAEVAAECQAKLDAKEEKEHIKKASIKRIANYEKKQADQGVVNNAMPWAPPSKSDPKPIKKNAIVAPPAVEDDMSISDAEMSDILVAPSKLKPIPIPIKKKAIVVPPAVKNNTSLSDAEMSDVWVAPSVPKPRPIPHKKKVIVDAPAVEDNEFLSDAEMDDVAADSSAFNPYLTQPSDMMASDSHADGSDSAMPSSPPRHTQGLGQ
ncbi:hypothetical protein EDB19DRAFT_1911616 [Suillus lakei]|nr:hypothetical protein EDB19DRAFT_1911616 [Suillus lakei]